MAESAPWTLFDACAGTGMLGTGVKLALELVGIPAVVVGGIERDACAASAFLAWMEQSQGFRPPLWDDVRTFCGRRDRGLEPVDVFCAGYPCQPFSAAGKRLGRSDPRHLWPEIRRIVARMQPGLVFFENVDGHGSLGLWKVLRDLERLGYEVTCGVFSAEETGAPHLRKRVFILGQSASRREWQRQRLGPETTARGESGPERHGPQLAISPSGGQSGCELGHTQHGETGNRGWPEARTANADSRRRLQGAVGGGGGFCADGVGQADSICKGLAQSAGERGDDGAECETAERARSPIPIYPPHRTDYRRWAELAALGLDPTLMPAIERGVSVVAHGLAPSSDLLRLGGNGVVPITAAWAMLNLACCLEEGGAAQTGNAR